jgi:UDP-glucose 6-dehydrogenase
MKIAVLGTGYVGLSTGVCLSQIGHHVTCIDINEQKINQLLQGISPIYEPGLEDLLTANMGAGRLHFTTSLSVALADAVIIVVAVGTPQGDDGAADLSYLVQAAKDLSAYITRDTIVVIKSTVPVGTNDFVKNMIECHCGFPVKMVSNPEFLRQGSAIEDTMKADRIIIGSEVAEAAGKIRDMYQPVTKAVKRFGGLKEKKIALLGLVFKPETDDMREAPSIPISEALTKFGAEVVAYDPVATENARKIIGDKIRYAGSIDEAIFEADAVFIVTEWNEIKGLDVAKKVEKMKEPIIYDGRNCLSEEKIRACSSIEYYPIGKPPIII